MSWLICVWLYNLIIRSLYLHNVPVSCKANRDRNQLGAWLDSDLIVEKYVYVYLEICVCKNFTVSSLMKKLTPTRLP